MIRQIQAPGPCFKTLRLPPDQYDIASMDNFTKATDREQCAGLCFTAAEECHFALWNPITGDCLRSSRYRFPNCATASQPVNGSEPAILFCISCAKQA